MSANAKGRLEASLCECCYEVFFSKKLFDSHVLKCGEPRSRAPPNTNPVGSSTLSKCATCRRIFLGGQNLAKHVKREHGTTKVVTAVLSCYECKMLFTDVHKLAKHREQEHAPSVSSAATVAAAPPGKPKMDMRSQPKVVTISQPKLVSKVDATSQPQATSKMKTKPTSEFKSKPESGSKSEPEPGLKTKSSSQELKTTSKPTDENASMPILDVASDQTQLVNEFICDADSETIVEEESEMIDVSSTNSPLTPEDSSRPARQMNVTSTVPEVTASTDQIPTKQNNASTTQPAAVSARMPASAPATPSVAKAASTSVATAATTATGAAAAKIASASAASASASADGVRHPRLPDATSSSGSRGVFFACGSCNFMFLDKDLMLKHLKEMHGRGVKSPAEKTPSASPAKKPVVRGSTMYACAMCDSMFNNVELVKSHIQAKHRGISRDGMVAKADLESGPRESVWSTQECLLCSLVFKPSVRLRDIYMNLPEWTNHFYGSHSTTEKLASGKRLELRPCHRCGLVFVNNATRLHHNAIAHNGRDPEAEMKQRQVEDNLEPVGPTTAQITPKSLTAKARSRVIVDSLMKASLVSRSTPTVTMDKVAARRAQSKVFASRTGSGRATNVVFKCSECGDLFPDDPSFERHAREAHRGESREQKSSQPPSNSHDPPPTTEVGQLSSINGQWDVLEQRECSDCSKLMESCPRSFALFVRRDVWERHVNEVHLPGQWRCTGELLRLHPCPQCPRLFLHPSTLEAHKTKLHDEMLGPVDQADVDACSPTNTLECSRCAELVQNADGIRFLDSAVWHKHFETDHKELLLTDGKAGSWQLFPCGKCQRLFFNERDIPIHEARQAYMHMPMPVNAKVTTQKRGHRVAQETEIMYQCANDDCSFTSHDHDSMVSHFQQCRKSRPTKIGETLLYKTVMVRRPPPKPRRHNMQAMRRLDNVMQKLAPGSATDGGEANATGAGAAGGEPSEAAAAVSQLLQAEPDAPSEPAVLELDPVTCQPRSAHALQAAQDVPEAVAEEETVAAEGPQPEHSAADDAADRPTRMDFACSVCKMRGSTKEEIAAHIRRDHKRSDGTYGPPLTEEDEHQQQIRNYKHAYLCAECKRMAEPCPRTRDLYFEKGAWIDHLSTSHKPIHFSELDRLDLHECNECERLFLSHASLKRHSRFYHEPGAENYQPEQQQNEDRIEKHKFSCVEEGCTFKYHRITRLRSHLINVHNFDLAVREVVFNDEDSFQEWKKTLELSTNAYFVLRSNVQAKRKNGKFNVRYFSCSRVMAHMPSYKQNGKKRTLPWQEDLLKDDMVWRCPAFMKAEVADNSTAINVSFCPNHYGHEMDPSFGRLTDSDEAEIGGMLRAGLSIQDVLKRMREEGQRQGTPNRKQRVTEAEINRIFEKYMGMKPPKAKRYDPLIGKAISRTSRDTGSPRVSWNADMVTFDGEVDAQGTVGEEMSLDDTEAADDGVGAREAWQRVCGEEDCRFTTTSVGFLRSHLRQRHGFAMHIDTAGFASMKDFTRWKRNLEKRTCAKYTCYKSVALSGPSDPVVTRYYTCHRSGLNSLKRASSHAPPPRRLVLCTGYMKVRCDRISGEVACEYCASHYGHDARLADRRVAEHAGEDMMPVEYETVEDDGEVSQPVGDQYSSPERNHFSSPSATRYSFIHEEESAAVSDQEVEPERPRRPRGRPPKKRPAARRRSRGGKRRRWEEFEEVEEEEEEDDQQQEDSFESD